MVLRVDFHTHTFASKDSLTRPEEFLAACRRVRLDRVVVTDHNSISGACRLQEMAPELIIVGEEVKTRQGELLAAYVTEVVPAGLPAEEAVQRLREQGAFISVSHPFDVRSGAWDPHDLVEIAPLVDAIEVFNARCMKPGANRLALDFARLHGLAGTAGSDAHAAFELGRTWLELPDFSGPQALRRSLPAGRVHGRMAPFWVHFFSRYARIKKEVGV